MHINLTEWMQVGLAALTATGVWAAPSLAPMKVTRIASNLNSKGDIVISNIVVDSGQTAPRPNDDV
jgi:hypothetical protein